MSVCLSVCLCLSVSLTVCLSVRCRSVSVSVLPEPSQGILPRQLGRDRQIPRQRPETTQLGIFRVYNTIVGGLCTFQHNTQQNTTIFLIFPVLPCHYSRTVARGRAPPRKISSPLDNCPFISFICMHAWFMLPQRTFLSPLSQLATRLQ